jgi:hypothetical protein
MNTVEFKQHCEEFMQQRFPFAASLEQEIGTLSPLEFEEWKTTLYCDYDKTYDVVRAIVKEMRAKENFVLNVSDQRKDPVKKPENQSLILEYNNIKNSVLQQMKNFDLFDKKEKELSDHINQYYVDESLKVTVHGVNYIAKKVIEVLHSGWESDNCAWLVDDNGEMKIVMSNHGSTYFANKSELEEKLKEYRDTIDATVDLLKDVK